ncbi:hypothetical protein RVV06_001498 [Enterobacter ludwigii]|nr:hypothetical protein [Enterobacter ludwigii]
MEFKGTKGEWEIMMDGDEIKVIQSSSLENGSGWRSYVAICEEVQCIEDANLIVAAPDLLEALQDMLSGWKHIRAMHGDLYGIGWDRAQDKAQSAISKALGDE